MATLFRNFSFEAAARHHTYHELTDENDHHGPESKRPVLNASPTSVVPIFQPARLPTPPPCSMGDLANILDKQTLRIDTLFLPNNSRSDEPLTPPSDTDISFSHHAPQPLQRFPTDSISRLNSATLRMQRQANVRMQCSTAHVRDISKLVEMVENRHQCNICEHKTVAPSSMSEREDEGVDMDYSPTGKGLMPYATHPPSFAYRASERDTGARVSKRPRMRKLRVTTK